jgi:hypothetical protein
LFRVTLVRVYSIEIFCETERGWVPAVVVHNT